MNVPAAPDPADPIEARARLGFAVKILGRPGMRDHDGRRWQSSPHLRVSLGYLAAIFDYLAETGIRMYRVSSEIAPYVTHPDLPQFHDQLEACAAELAALGARARQMDLRLSTHPAQYIVLNSPQEHVARAATADLAYHAALLDALGMGPECKIVIHAGGVYGDRAGAMDRFVARYRTLPASVRRRLVLENDEVSYGVLDILAIHERTGIPLVFDTLHHQVHHPGDLSATEACRRCVATWPAGQTAKIHFSSPRTAPREVTRRDPTTGDRVTRLAPPKPGQHADWIDADAFIAFLRATPDLRYDVMLEAKQKDLALLRLREAVAAAGLRDRVW